ncbi:MAG TPA: hypothetical protein ACFYEK_10995, partial [Candidatus Wunengus sp. YC60]|uniref:hypothetical protein n=1 Tax=Candidatus Wunengus sp. YC60 TaxID=3367697 RepID=UPI00402573B9
WIEHKQQQEKKVKTIRRDWIKRQIAKGNMEIRCKMVLTDDYAYDNDSNFQKSEWKLAKIEDFNESDFTYSTGHASQAEDNLINWTMLCNHYYQLRLITDKN